MEKIPPEIWYRIFAECKPLSNILNYSIVSRKFKFWVHGFIHEYIPRQLSTLYAANTLLIAKLSKERHSLSQCLSHLFKFPLYAHPLLQEHQAPSYWVDLELPAKRIIECLVWIYWDKQRDYEAKAFLEVPRISGKMVLYTLRIPEWRECCLHVWPHYLNRVGSLFTSRLLCVFLYIELPELLGMKPSNQLKRYPSTGSSISSRLMELEPVLKHVDTRMQPFLHILVGIALYWQCIHTLEQEQHDLDSSIFQLERWSSRYVLECTPIMRGIQHS